MKKFLKNIILYLVQLVEYFEYRNKNLDEKILNSVELNNFEVETDKGFDKATHVHITKPFYIYDLYLETKAEKSLSELMISYNEDINFDSETGELSIEGKPHMPFSKEIWFGIPSNDETPEIEIIGKDETPDITKFSNINWATTEHNSGKQTYIIPVGKKLKTDSPNLSAADEHIVFDKDMNQVFIKDLKINDYIQTKDGLRKVKRIKRRKQKVSMFDLTIDSPDHRYYTNDILSHNTVMTTIYLAWVSIFSVDKNIMCLSNKGDSSKEIMAKTKIIFEHMPFFMKPGILKNDVMEMKFDNGCRLKSTNTTKRSAIGFAIDVLYIDEMAHIAENIIDEFWENVYPTVSEMDGKIILTSTPNSFNLFADIFTKAVDGKNDFNPIEVTWQQLPGRDKAWYDREIANLGEDGFMRQYGNSFSVGAGLLLSPKKIEELKKQAIQFEDFYYERIEDLGIKGCERDKLMLKPDLNLDNLKAKYKFYLFTIDLAEGGGGDYSVLNIFEVKSMSINRLSHVLAPTSFQDFFALEQVGILKSNTISIEDFAKITYLVLYEIFNSENVKVIVESNIYGNEFIHKMQTCFPGKNEFEEENIVRFKHKSDARVPKMGIKIRSDNKSIMAQDLKKYINNYRLNVYDKFTVNELKTFGKNKNGRYQGISNHDDCVMTCIHASQFFNTVEFADLVEEKYEFLNQGIVAKINEELEIKNEDGEDSLYYDIYETIGGKSKNKSTVDVDFM